VQLQLLLVQVVVDLVVDVFFVFILVQAYHLQLGQSFHQLHHHQHLQAARRRLWLEELHEVWQQVTVNLIMKLLRDRLWKVLIIVVDLEMMILLMVIGEGVGMFIVHL